MNTIQERIKKLLAMSNDAASPNEAAIALKRARYLMDKHQITELDQEQEPELGESYSDSFSARMPAAVSKLALQIGLLNDCITTRHGTKIRYQGLLTDTISANVQLSFLINLINKNALNIKGAANKNDYKLGFVSGIAQQVRAIKDERMTNPELVTSSGTSLVVVKNQAVQAKFGIQKTTRRRMRAAGAYYTDGQVDGKRTSLNREIGTQRTGIEQK